MSILITGASGFIGSRVLKRLIDEYGADNIIALSGSVIDGVRTLPSRGYDFDENYILDNGGENVDILLHIGAFIPKSGSDADNIRSSNENIINTQKLLDLKLPCLKKIVFISTIDVYAQCGEVFSENTVTVPATMYGWSKLYCEQMIIKHCRSRNISFEILRLGHVYGEGEECYKKVMPVMIRNAVNSENLTIYGDGNASRSFIYIEDAAHAIVNSLKLDSCETINIVGDEAVTVNQLAEMICSLADEDISIKHIQLDAQNVDYVFDNSKMKEKLLSDLIPFKEGLEREYNYLKGVMGK